jgi:phospholipid-binding lipoprotein MlaA
MRYWAIDLSILVRVTALLLVSGFSACSSGGVGAQASADSLRSASASILAPTDVADLPDAARGSADPFEKMNRSVFESNQQFNHAVVYPVAKAYHNNVPEPVRNSVENFAGNLTEPMVFANDALQLRLGAAATTAGRFALNSTLGVGGLFDVASKQKLERQTGDFGQTLYVWGMRKSNYLVVPIIGPTNVRDLIGTTVNFGWRLGAGGV